MNAALPMEYLACFLAGALFGSIYFYAVFRTARLVIAGAALSKIAPLYVLRCAGALLVFWIAAQRGPLPLLLTLAGFIAARFLVQLVVRSRENG